MFEEPSGYDDGYEQHEESSLRALQRAALVIYGRFVASQSNDTSDDDEAATKEHYLSLQEVEHIVREHATIQKTDDGNYVIGAESAEEANKMVHAVMAALMDRVMSNVLRQGVRDGLIDCAYDSDANDFMFSVTDAGKAKAEEYRNRNGNHDYSDDTAD